MTSQAANFIWRPMGRLLYWGGLAITVFASSAMLLNDEPWVPEFFRAKPALLLIVIGPLLWYAGVCRRIRRVER